jgi:hypothetical protein
MKRSVTIRIVGSQSKEDWYFLKVNSEVEASYDVVSGDWQVLEEYAPDKNFKYFVKNNDAVVVKKEPRPKTNLIGKYKNK